MITNNGAIQDQRSSTLLASFLEKIVVLWNFKHNAKICRLFFAGEVNLHVLSLKGQPRFGMGASGFVCRLIYHANLIGHYNVDWASTKIDQVMSGTMSF